MEKYPDTLRTLSIRPSRSPGAPVITVKEGKAFSMKSFISGVIVPFTSKMIFLPVSSSMTGISDVLMDRLVPPATGMK
ncbi:MAG TPA: hypothetical protein PLP82_13860 [Deltaproteobacteria bacterium]|nr:hypothetical protein [Deltaproteobacteria bacterium]